MRIIKAASYLFLLLCVVYGLFEKQTEELMRVACAMVTMAAATYILRGCRDE